jgi:hypothetical protein
MVRTITSKVTSARKEHISKKSSLKSKKKIIGFVATAASAAIVSISTLGARVPRPKHTSILTGQRWINELLKGHPDRFHEQIGMRKHVFRRLLKELQLYHGLQDSKYVRAEEQLAIFLHLARTGLSSRMLQERFQRSADTISVFIELTVHHPCIIMILTQLLSYVHKLTNMFIGSFYKRYVKPMRENETPPEVASNPKLFPYFRESRGTLDGSHFNSWVSEEATARFRNRKGGISQNVLAGSDYDLKFIYILSGWEGSASDSRIFEYARREDLKLPNGCYLLADAGFPICDMLMTPYRGKRYHLKEWGRGNQKCVIPNINVMLPFSLLYFSTTGHRIMKNFSIFAIHRHAMLSNGFSVCSSAGLRLRKLHQNIRKIYRPCLCPPLAVFTISFASMTHPIKMFNHGGPHSLSDSNPIRVKMEMRHLPQRSLMFKLSLLPNSELILHQRKSAGQQIDVITLQNKCGLITRKYYINERDCSYE